MTVHVFESLYIYIFIKYVLIQILFNLIQPSIKKTHIITDVRRTSMKGTYK